MLVLLSLLSASAAPPADLDRLVEVAFAQHPLAVELAPDADAARARSVGAGRPMDPQLMLGVVGIGAPMDAPDPTMWMVGVTQMFRGFGEGRALAERATDPPARARDACGIAGSPRVIRLVLHCPGSAPGGLR